MPWCRAAVDNLTVPATKAIIDQDYVGITAKLRCPKLRSPRDRTHSAVAQDTKLPPRPASVAALGYTPPAYRSHRGSRKQISEHAWETAQERPRQPSRCRRRLRSFVRQRRWPRAGGVAGGSGKREPFSRYDHQAEHCLPEATGERERSAANRSGDLSRSYGNADDGATLKPESGLSAALRGYTALSALISQANSLCPIQGAIYLAKSIARVSRKAPASNR